MDELAELKAEVTKLTQQVAGLAAERNSFRQKSEGYERLLEQVEPDSLMRDANGFPVGFNVPEAAQTATSVNGHPFSGVLDDPTQADAWVRQQAEALFKQQGFVSQTQLNQLIQQATNQAYQAARQDAMLWRQYDQLLSKELPGPDGKPMKAYQDLGSMDSALAKSVARILKEKEWGEPMSEQASSFATDWRYRHPKAIEWAADLARLELSQQASQGQAAAQTGQAAQAAAGLAGKPTGGAPTTQPRIKELMGQGASSQAVLEELDSMSAPITP